MPLPFIIAGAAALAGATAGEVVGAAVVGAVANELLSDDTSKIKTKNNKHKLSEQELSKYLSPEERRRMQD